MKISDIATVKRGSSPRPIINYISNKGYPWLKISDFTYGERYVFSTKEYIIEEGLKNTRYVPKGTLIVTNSASPGIPIFLGKDMCLHDGFLYFENLSNQVVPMYLYYFILSNRDYLVSQGNGSVFTNLKKEILENMPIELPEISHQRHIVDILGSIDEKIESNNKIIDKNNAIMRLLFSNFYEKMKLSSETVPIGSLELTVSDFVANGSFASLKENVEILDNLSYAYFIRNTDLKAGAFNKFVSEDAYRFLAKSALYGHEVLISNVGDVGSVFLCPKLNKPMTLGNNMIFINSKGKDCYNYYLFFLFSSEEGQYLIRGITGGSAQPKFNKTDFRNIMVYNPSEKLLADFNKNVEVYLNRNTLCHSENLNLNRLKQLYLKKFFG